MSPFSFSFVLEEDFFFLEWDRVSGPTGGEFEHTFSLLSHRLFPSA